MRSFEGAVRGLLLGTFIGLSTLAQGAPVVQSLDYPLQGGYTATGSVTYDDAIRVPNAAVGAIDSTAGMIDFALTVTGPGLPGGSTSFTFADLDGWYFFTNGSNAITDLNFFSHANGEGCTVYGVEEFLLSVYCTGGDVENPLEVLRLTLDATPPAPGVPVPALSNASTAALSALVAILALVSLGLARQARRRVPRRS